MLDKIKSIGSIIVQAAVRLLGRAPVYYVVNIALAYAATRWPDLPMPDASLLTDFILGLLTVHTVADAWRLTKVYIEEQATKAEQLKLPKVG